MKKGKYYYLIIPDEVLELAGIKDKVKIDILKDKILIMPTKD